MYIYTHTGIYACVHVYAYTWLPRSYCICLTSVLALFERFKCTILWSLDGTTAQMTTKVVPPIGFAGICFLQHFLLACFVVFGGWLGCFSPSIKSCCNLALTSVCVLWCSYQAAVLVSAVEALAPAAQDDHCCPAAPGLTSQG